MKRRIAAIAAVIALGIGLSACGTDNFRDREGVSSINPDYVENYNNMDKHPNIGLVCIRGVGFVTTTRDSFAAIQRVKEWDSFCSQFPQHAVIKKQER